MKIATWNVNSVKVRLPQLVAWLKADAPEIVLLQEIKCVSEAFPAMEIEELGYNLAVHGQKTYNGVAILSKFPLSDIVRELPGEAADVAARYIEAVASLPGGKAVRVASVYVPNGQDAESDKFQYKLRFLDRLQAHVTTLLGYGEMLALGGDYNIAPEDRDVHNPKAWQGSVLTHDEVRARLRRMLGLGVYDAYRLKNEANDYSWWDYRTGAFDRDDGLRIDHILLSPQACDVLDGCTIKKEMRGLEKASDHAPVVAAFSF